MLTAREEGFTVELPESHLVESYDAQNPNIYNAVQSPNTFHTFLSHQNLKEQVVSRIYHACFISSRLKEQDMLLIYPCACFVSSSLKEQDMITFYPTCFISLIVKNEITLL